IARFPVRIELRFEERQPCNVIEGPHEAADHGEETLFTAVGPGVDPVQRSKPQGQRWYARVPETLRRFDDAGLQSSGRAFGRATDEVEYPTAVRARGPERGEGAD